MLDKTKLSPARDLIRQAADYIDENGWWTASMPVGKGACAILAILRVADSSHDPNIPKAIGLIQNHIGNSSVPSWNDKQTKEIVIQTMRDVAYGL